MGRLVSTIAASTNTAATSHRPRWRRTALNTRERRPAEFSHHEVSGLAGVVQSHIEGDEGASLCGFTNDTLIAIAELLAADDAALVAIPGSARKLKQFGPDVLEMVRARSYSINSGKSRSRHSERWRGLTSPPSESVSMGSGKLKGGS